MRMQIASELLHICKMFCVFAHELSNLYLSFVVPYCANYFCFVFFRYVGGKLIEKNQEVEDTSRSYRSKVHCLITRIKSWT